MSTNTLLKVSAMTAFAVVGTAITASAGDNSRYGGPSVYDYESGQNCGQACASAPVYSAPVTTRYGTGIVQQAPITQAPPIYLDCSQLGTCGYTQPTYSQPAPVYSQPATVYSQPATVYSQPAPVQSYSTQSYSTPSYSAPATSYQAPAECPAGTTPQSDGTCLESSFSTSSYDSYSSSSYSAPTTSYDSASSFGSSTSYGTTAPANCPAGTTAQSDGTCMEGGSSSFSSGASAYTGSSVEIFSGDAAASSSSSYGYTSDGAYGLSDYLPIRK